MPSFLAVDTETTGVDLWRSDRAYAFPMCDDEGNSKCYVWSVDPFTRKVRRSRKDIKKIEADLRGKELVFFNAKFDIVALTKAGIRFDWRGKVHDAGVSSHVIHSAKHRQYKGELKSLALHYCDYPDFDEEKLRSATRSAKLIVKNNNLGWSMSSAGKDHIAPNYWILRALCEHNPELLPDVDEWESGDDPTEHPWYSLLETYAVSDAERTMLLHLLFTNKMDADQSRCYKREMQLTEVLYDMQSNGFTIKSDQLKKESKRYKKVVDESLTVMKTLIHDTEFNPESPQQLRSVLFDKLKFKPKKKTSSGEYSTDKDVQKELVAEAKRGKQKSFIKALTTYKNSSKALSYLVSYSSFDHSGLLYPNINQCGTSTVRVSSSDPNGQNVSKGKELEDGEKPEFNLRAVFGPALGRIWYCIDYSQLQLRIFAYLSGERSLIEAFANGYDAHTYMAMRIFDKPADQISSLQRRIAKNVNFGFVFGAQPDKIEQTAGMPGLWDTVTSMFPNAHDYMKKTKDSVYRNKYVKTAGGYKLYIPYKNGKLAAHAGVNYEVQGTEGELVKNAMVSCDQYIKRKRKLGFNGYLSFQVHDELIFDFDASQKRMNRRVVTNVARLMEQAGAGLGMVTPVDIEYTTTNWAETRKLAA